jgi:hypothetical protein
VQVEVEAELAAELLGAMKPGAVQEAQGVEE